MDTVTFSMPPLPVFIKGQKVYFWKERSISAAHFPSLICFT
ncbi:hypothetical protein LR69_02908 [Geobacillus sp. BCO2]|nr:hypothetical protein LR69_02908 [Geobacillus sp. BCO2]